MAGLSFFRNLVRDKEGHALSAEQCNFKKLDRISVEVTHAPLKNQKENYVLNEVIENLSIYKNDEDKFKADFLYCGQNYEGFSITDPEYKIKKHWYFSVCRMQHITVTAMIYTTNLFVQCTRCKSFLILNVLRFSAIIVYRERGVKHERFHHWLYTKKR